MVEDDFSRIWVDDTSCPNAVPASFYMPCRHFSFVAPGTGVLQVILSWDGKRTEAAGLVVGEIEADPGWIAQTGVYRYANPKTMRVRVQAGEHYRIMAFLVTSHLDYLGWLAGPFQLIATME
jgi:hypothetical protein